MWFRGTVVDVQSRSDGDLHVDVKPAAGYNKFLDHGNEKDQNGAMVAEIMPGQTFPKPTAGESIALFGTWVHDTHNDWNEIHPIWTIDYVDRGSEVTSWPPATPLYTGGAND